MSRRLAADEYRKTTFAQPVQYAEGRRSLTDDVNAAISGLPSGAATEIVFVHGHGSGNSRRTRHPDRSDRPSRRDALSLDVVELQTEKVRRVFSTGRENIASPQCLAGRQRDRPAVIVNNQADIILAKLAAR